jgi:hypothetical protein
MSITTASQSQIGQETAKNSQIVTTSVRLINSGASIGPTGPSISSIVVTDSGYNNLDDTAAATSNSYIRILGTGFESTANVFLNGTMVPKANITFVSSSELRAVLPVSNTGNYAISVYNSNSSGALYSSSFVISTMPQWLTSTTLTGVTTNTQFSNTLSATSDSSVTYSNTTILPTGVILLSNGYYYGTITSANTYSFGVKATDVENQDSTRTFSLSASLPVAADDFYSSTGVILKADGSFIDQSPYASTITNSSGTPTELNTTTKKYGSGSARFYRNASTSLSVATNSNLDLTGTFTIEGWVYLTGHPSGLNSICGKWGGSNYSYLVTLQSSGSMESTTLVVYFNEGSTGPSFSFSTPTLNTGGWYHIALVRNGNSLLAFLNGTQVGSTQSYSGTPATRSGPLTIGSAGEDGHHFDGFIDDLRITKGIARYTTTFTPPDSVPVSGLPTATSINYLLVAGGGAGGGSAGDQNGAGGGAGGWLEGTITGSGLSYTVTIGGGGASGSQRGDNTTLANSAITRLTYGGGMGGGAGSSQPYSYNGQDGGSGGGGGIHSGVTTRGSSIQTSNNGGTGYGNAGGANQTGSPYTGGGGGGAGAEGISGTSGGAGGAGRQWLDGTYYAGGGGTGYNQYGAVNASGGTGGGGTGGTSNGSTNTGGGGGGRMFAGGSGVCIFRYPDTFAPPSYTSGSPTVTVSGGYRYYKFTSSGSITF